MTLPSAIHGYPFRIFRGYFELRSRAGATLPSAIHGYPFRIFRPYFELRRQSPSRAVFLRLRKTAPRREKECLVSGRRQTQDTSEELPHG